VIERLLVLTAVTVTGLLVVRLLERTRRGGTAVPAGITVVTGSDCRLCEAVLSLLDARGIRYTSATVQSIASRLNVRSLPTVLVADHVGSVVLRRSGRSALTDLDSILLAAGGTGSGS